jgi:Undecaprenyl-phosphate glucose phosphotransferase
VSSWAQTQAELLRHPNAEISPLASRFRLPYDLVEPTVFFLDLIFVLSISLLSAIGYSWAVYDHVQGVEGQLAFGVLTLANVSALLAARGDYKIHSLVNFKRQAIDLLFVWTGVFFLLLTAVFTLKAGGSLSRGATLSFFAVGLTGVIAWRGLLARYLSRALSAGAFAQQNVIVIRQAGRPTEHDAISEMRRCGYKPVRIFELADECFSPNQTTQSLKTAVDEVIEAVRSEMAAEIFLLINWDRSDTIENITRKLSVLPTPVHLLPDENVFRYLRRRTIDVGTIWAAEIQRAPLGKLEQIVKRCFDLCGATVVLLMLSPLMLMTALLIKLDSRGPIFFLQSRNGFNGATFKIVKFRSMHVLEDGHVIRQATRSDPRVTRLGRWLRRTNIDELPQLFNVLYGNMSLVGPRPHAVAHNNEFEKRIAKYAYRHHVKPGITGWAQVNGFRGETATTDLMEKRVNLDLWYVNNWSIWVDVKILIRTLVIGLQPTAY